MEALRILDTPDVLSWEYDEDGEVLYISVGEPGPAVTVDLGESALARYDENEQKLVGITILNVRKRPFNPWKRSAYRSGADGRP